MSTKGKGLKIERDLGQVTKRLSNGMWETKKGEKTYTIPPYPGIEVGDKVKINAQGGIEKPEKEVPTVGGDDTVSRAEFEALKKQNEELAKLLGEKGSDVKKGAANA